MNDFPDFSERGYQIQQQIGQNRECDRVTYLAQIIQTQTQVILHQFLLPQSENFGSGEAALAQEIHALKKLNHPGIPRYLDSFIALGNFWLVQEYKNALPLTSYSQFNAQTIKLIALAILEILVYLQKCNPSIIHQAIRPENILFNGREVYLINFRFSLEPRTAEHLKFLAPEQLINYKLTAAIDLYSLGITLIYLLAQTNPIRDLGNSGGRIRFQHLMPKDLSLHFINWLDTMVQPNRHERYPDAATALKALQKIDLKRLPEVRGIPKTLELTATRIGETLIQSFTISNSIPDTIIKGRWRVALHPNDPLCRPGNHAWIAFDPVKFEGNQVSCKIVVNTGMLRANQIYQRRLLLETNAASKPYTIVLKVKTAALSYKQLPLFSLIPLLIFSTAAGQLGIWVLQQELLLWGSAFIGIGLGWGAGWGATFSRTELLMSALRIAASVTAMMVVASVGTGPSDAGFTGYITGSFLSSFGVGFVMGWIGVVAIAHTFKNHVKRKFSQSFAVAISILSGALGITLGVGLRVGFINPLVRLALAGIGLPFALMLLSPLLTQAIGLARYYLSRLSLIKP
jgi:serine/threonine protein kinase